MEEGRTRREKRRLRAAMDAMADYAVTVGNGRVDGESIRLAARMAGMQSGDVRRALRKARDFKRRREGKGAAGWRFEPGGAGP